MLRDRRLPLVAQLGLLGGYGVTNATPGYSGGGGAVAKKGDLAAFLDRMFRDRRREPRLSGQMAAWVANSLGLELHYKHGINECSFIERGLTARDTLAQTCPAAQSEGWDASRRGNSSLARRAKEGGEAAGSLSDGWGGGATGCI